MITMVIMTNLVLFLVNFGSKMTDNNPKVAFKCHFKEGNRDKILRKEAESHKLCQKWRQYIDFSPNIHNMLPQILTSGCTNVHITPRGKPTPFEDYYESIIYALQSAFWLNHFSNPRYKTHIFKSWLPRSNRGQTLTVNFKLPDTACPWSLPNIW